MSSAIDRGVTHTYIWYTTALRELIFTDVIYQIM